jgi:hypothetical protein
MYVEISARQTGKTTRLVDDLVNFLQTNGDKSALVVSSHNPSRKSIKQKIMEKCGLPCVNRTITSHKMLPPSNSMKQYVDEFFYLEPNKLVLDENAYYTGTPKEGIYGIYEEIYSTFQIKNNGNMVPIKPIKRHGFGGNS